MASELSIPEVVRGIASNGGDPLRSAPAAGAPPLAEEPRVRGEALLRGLERGFLALDRCLPEPLNPFQQTGAIAVTSLAIATATGVVLLLWYSPSVHLAYDSVAGMSARPWSAAGLTRALHRYSSDACMLFTVLHALRLLFERRLTHARWLPWVTGVASVLVLWLVGWTGYWLVWDAPAKHVALGSARLIDALPLFVDPLGRSLLTDAGVNSLLFFVVFFVHMLIPLALGVTLWLHLLRTARPHFLTRRGLSLGILGGLLILCAVYPPALAEPARLAIGGEHFGMDWWYLLPVLLTDRLGGGALWIAGVALSAVTASAPWWIRRGAPRPARVEPSRCNACMQCFNDCPFEAIHMVPRSDGREDHYLAEARVDPALCTSCGVCAGSCDSAGVGLDVLPVRDVRRRIEAWLAQAAERGETTNLALVCAESAGANLRVDPVTGLSDALPDYRVLQIPCAGWVHPMILERALRRGAGHALVVTCGAGQCHYREGATWLEQRLDGARVPAFRGDRAPRDRIAVLALDHSRTGELVERARALARDAEPARPRGSDTPRRKIAALAVVAVLVLGGVGAGSNFGYATPQLQGSELVVNFKHPGAISEHCRDLSEQELASRPVHMRQKRVCDRRRAPVRLRVRIDGRQVFAGVFPPAGLWGDLNSVGVETIPVRPGEHRVRVEVGDSLDPNEWRFASERSIRFPDSQRRVVGFDRVAGFSWN